MSALEVAPFSSQCSTTLLYVRYEYCTARYEHKYGARVLYSCQGPGLQQWFEKPHSGYPRGMSPLYGKLYSAFIVPCFAVGAVTRFPLYFRLSISISSFSGTAAGFSYLPSGARPSSLVYTPVSLSFLSQYNNIIPGQGKAVPKLE